MMILMVMRKLRKEIETNPLFLSILFHSTKKKKTRERDIEYFSRTVLW